MCLHRYGDTWQHCAFAFDPSLKRVENVTMKTHTTNEAVAANSDRQTAGAGHTAQLQNASGAAIVDTSAAALTLQRYQQLANNSPQAMQLMLQAEMMAAGPAAVTLQRYQQMANNSPQALQLKQQAETMAASTSGASMRATQLYIKGVVQRVGNEELLQGKFDALQRGEEHTPLQDRFEQAASSIAPPAAAVQREEKPNNTGLPDQLKSGIESLSGISMDHVKVHHNSDKPAQLQAHAYAQGNEIHLGAGQERHLPHEAWHVVQQAQGRVKPTMQMKAGVPVNDDEGLEAEADVMGAKAAGLVQRKAEPGVFTHSSVSGGSVVQRLADLVSQVVVTDGVVTEASLPSRERTEGVLGGLEGSHTTPWSVFVESVRMAVQGKTLADAVAALDALFNVAQALPGVARVMFMMGNEQFHYQQALLKATGARLAAVGTATQDNLQRFMSAYLEYRNVIPFSAVDTGAPANYNNEGPRLETIRNYQNESPADIKAAILELLDLKTVAKLGEVIEHTEAAVDVRDQDEDEAPAVQVNPQVPGADVNEAIEVRLAGLIMQHMQSMKAGFPEAYHKANFALSDILNRFFPQVQVMANYDSDAENSSDDDAPALNRATFNQTFVLPIRDVLAPPRASIGKNTPGGVQLRMNDNGTIASVLINTQDRPEGLFGSADKKHATAWIVFVSGAQRAVIGRTLANAVTALDALYDSAESLPGVSKGYLLLQPRKQQWVDAMQAVIDAKEAANGNPSMNNVQTYIRTYLRFRNFIPLSAANIPGAGPGGHAESTNIAIVETPADHEPVAVRNAVYNLLDSGVVKAFGLGKGITAQNHDVPFTNSPSRDVTDQGDTVDMEVPGAQLGNSMENRTAQVIKQHLETIRANFPDAYARGEVNSQASIEHFLETKLLIDKLLTRQAISATVRA
jgi:hypothetical protein